MCGDWSRLRVVVDEQPIAKEEAATAIPIDACFSMSAPSLVTKQARKRPLPSGGNGRVEAFFEQNIGGKPIQN